MEEVSERSRVRLSRGAERAETRVERRQIGRRRSSIGCLDQISQLVGVAYWERYLML